METVCACRDTRKPVDSEITVEDQDAPRIWRLSQGASSERRMVSDCISNIQLSNDPDTRVLASMKAKPFSTSGAYRLLQQDTEQQTDIMLLWSTRLPTKVKFFAWLLSHGRLNTREYLYRRSIRKLEEAYCECCPTVMETDEHIFISCPVARQVWRRLGLDADTLDLRRPWQFPLNSMLPDTVCIDVVLLLLWHMWKARNAKIFDHVNSSPLDIIRRVLKDMDLWSCRFRHLHQDLQSWLASVTN